MQDWGLLWDLPGRHCRGCSWGRVRGCLSWTLPCTSFLHLKYLDTSSWGHCSSEMLHSRDCCQAGWGMLGPLSDC